MASPEDIFSRQRLLLGDAAQEKLAAAHVMVCGLGGVGSYVAEGLARCGVGRLTLVDFDRVEYSNINRQLYALTTTIGQFKTDVAAERIRQINPCCQITVSRAFIKPETAEELVAAADYVADAIDHIPGKLGLILAGRRLGVPTISALGAAQRLDSSRIIIGDISSTHTCPLARNLRKQLKEAGVSGGVTVAFSSEPPLKPALAEAGKSNALGSVVFVPAVMGLMIAGHIVNRIVTGKQD